MNRENKLLKVLTKQCIFFFLVMFLSSILLTMISGQTIFGLENGDGLEDQNVAGKENAIEGSKEETWLKEKEHNTKEIKKKLGENYIKIRKNQADLLSVDFTEYSMERELVLDIYDMRKTSISEQDIITIWNGKKQENLEALKKKAIKDVSIGYTTAEKGKFSATITFQWNHVYTYQIYEDKDFIYVDCRKPKDVYEHIVVVDAGHGGEDTGSYAKRGTWSEKDYNLDFVSKIAASWQDNRVKLYFTRTKDEALSLSERVEFANEVEADLFVSIHCNSTDEYAGSGLEALYKSNRFKEESKAIAKKSLENLEEATGLVNRGVLDGQSIYIIRNANMPTILLEMGFLSDEKDLAYIEQEDCRQKMAEVICTSITQGLEQIR